MISLKHGCTETLEDGRKIVHLYDQSGSMPEEKWVGLVKKHIQENNNQHIINQIKAQYKHHTDEKQEEIALCRYSWDYQPQCEEYQEEEPIYTEVIDDMGCSQLVFC